MKEQSAFNVGPLGFFEYIKIPFGMSNSPATYQRVMEECLGDLKMKICIIYLDDLIIFSKDFNEHLERLDTVSTHLKECNLKLSADKCVFIKPKVKFLGHIVRETDPEKVEKVKNWQIPADADALRSFVAFTGYYRRFIKDFSNIAKPLLRKGKPKWLRYRGIGHHNKALPSTGLKRHSYHLQYSLTQTSNSLLRYMLMHQASVL
jgi:hypothetical protein